MTATSQPSTAAATRDQKWNPAQKQNTQKTTNLTSDEPNDIKPSVNELASSFPSANASNGNAAIGNFPPNDRSLFVQKIKNTYDPPAAKRPRDDLDDLFAQMNSDAEDEDDYF